MAKWIQRAIKRPGALRRQLGIKKGQKIPAKTLRAAAKKKGKLGARARLAITLRKLSRRRKKRRKSGSSPIMTRGHEGTAGAPGNSLMAQKGQFTGGL